MDNRPVKSLTKKFKETTEKIVSTLPENHGEKHTLGDTSTPIKIKEEQATVEIQEYAAITMSELLGWYGYNKVDSDCTRSLNLDHFSSLPRATNNQLLQMKSNFISSKEKPKSPLPLITPNLPGNGPTAPLQYAANNLAAASGQIPSTPLSLKKETIDYTNNVPYNNFSSSICTGDAFCSWCGRITETCKSGRTNSHSCNSINALGHFCSEACFTAGKRAVFKRTKTCNWCRHIKNPISYVDVQDGESQLQFCSDKCLNQYKMNIFCHETQTHLMLHGLNTVSCHDTEKGNLITPELWFRNCQSPIGSGSTENAFPVDEHAVSDLSSHDKSKENGENETEKSIESARKMIRKRDSFYIELCSKAGIYNGNKKNVHAEINENDVSEEDKRQSFANEDNRFCRCLNNQNRYIVNCSQQNALNCNNLTENCSLINVINCDSHSREHNDTVFKNNIHVKDIRVLQEEKKDAASENASSPRLFAGATLSKIEHDASLPHKYLTNKFNRTTHKKQINSSARRSPSMQSGQAESSIRALSSNHLPPVTVLVPYPIPVPIPIPIPVPIPTPILNKFLVDEQKIPVTSKDMKYKNTKCNESIESKCSMIQEPQFCRNTNMPVSDEPQLEASAKLCVSLNSSNINNKNDNGAQQAFKYSGKPPRKRKHFNENINYEHKEQQLKKRNKSIAT
ncbi:sine oculis-binding protein [Augochlora pura]